MQSLNLPDVDFIDYLKFVGQQECQEIIPAHQFRDTIFNYAENGMQIVGPELPWSKVSSIIRLLPGQLSVWAGHAGSGKSTLLGQVIAWRTANQTAVIASMEMHPHKTLYKMACQLAGCHPAKRFISGWLDYLDGKLWVYDQLDSVKPDRVLGMAHYVFNEMSVDHLVVDSLTKCGFAKDDYTAQAKFVDKLQWIAKRYNRHIHLVCHMRKPPAGSNNSSRGDIRGAGEIVDLADNVFIIQRNHGKEQALTKQESGVELTIKESDLLSQPDTFLKVNKNREHGIEQNFGLWFHKESSQYTPADRKEPLPQPYNFLGIQNEITGY